MRHILLLSVAAAVFAVAEAYAGGGCCPPSADDAAPAEATVARSNAETEQVAAKSCNKKAKSAKSGGEGTCGLPATAATAKDGKACDKDKGTCDLPAAKKGKTCDKEKGTCALPKADKTADIEQTTCPVMGGKIDTDISIEHDGRTVYFCCKGCIEPFRKNPDKYLSKLDEQAKEAEKK